MLVANEFFDALPVRQFIGGIERRVVLTPAGLAFDRDGEVVEDSPVRDEAAREIGALLDERGGVALVIDYGHAKHAPRARRSRRCAAMRSLRCCTSRASRI